MIDTHYHLEAAGDPATTAAAIDEARVITVAVTSLPSSYAATRTRLHRYRYIRPALGLHPLMAARHTSDVQAFRELVGTTSYVGEIGLDFSPEGRESKDAQISVFQAILTSISGLQRLVTVHSRGAEKVVLSLLQQERVGPVVFHWYSGPLGTLTELLAAGHLCSINPAMVRSSKGRQIISRIPRERTLSETDGPYVAGRNGSATPADVAIVIDYLALAWRVPRRDVELQLFANFRRLLPGAVVEASSRV